MHTCDIFITKLEYQARAFSIKQSMRKERLSLFELEKNDNF